MEQSVRTQTGPPREGAERRGRSAPAAVAVEPIPFPRPELPAPGAIMAYLQRSRDEAQLAGGGHCGRELTARIEERLGHRTHCVLVSSATSGLIAALRAVCGEPRARRRLVACPSFTFAATARAISWAGFEPLFVDIEPDGCGLDPEALDAALKLRRGRVAGILACAPFGSAPHGALRSAWREIAARRGTPLLLDSAPGFGALDENGLPLGAEGDTEVFSLHATKPFATEPSTRTSREPGLNGTLPELQAATGLAVLDELDEILGRRRELAARAMRAATSAGLRYQRNAIGSTWQSFQALAPDPARRERILVAAAAARVDARTPHDPPLHRHPPHRRWASR